MKCNSTYKGSATGTLYRCELDPHHTEDHQFTFVLSETLTRTIRWDD